MAPLMEGFTVLTSIGTSLTDKTFQPGFTPFQYACVLSITLLTAVERGSIENPIFSPSFKGLNPMRLFRFSGIARMSFIDCCWANVILESGGGTNLRRLGVCCFSSGSSATGSSSLSAGADHLMGAPTGFSSASTGNIAGSDHLMGAPTG